MKTAPGLNRNERADVIDERQKQFDGAALDLEIRARNVIDGKPGAEAALVIALRNFSVAHRSLSDTACHAPARGEATEHPEKC